MAFGIDMGPSNAENTQYNNLSGLSSTVANEGLSDLSQSQGFMSAILSGDPAKIGQVLGPQIQAIQQQGQQQKQTNAQFHNRSGGTNASNQTVGDKVTSGVNNLVSSLTGTALNGLNNTGLSLVNTGANGFSTAFGEADTMQQQNAAKWNDIFNSISQAISAVAGMPGVGKSAAQGLDAAAGAF